MDINRKRVLLIPLEGVLSEGDITDFHIQRDILDKVRKMNFSRIVLLTDETADKDQAAKVKAVEFFIFAFCKTAVSTHHRGGDLISDIMSDLQFGLRKIDLFLSVGEKIDEIDYISKEDFIQR